MSERFAIFDDNGYPIAFYWSDLHEGRIPENATSISIENWQECVDNPGLRKFVNGTLVECENKKLSENEQWKFVRETRNFLLKESDWTQFPDVQTSMSEENKNEWASYRKNLRDVPQNFSSPYDITWPSVPVSGSK